MSKKYNAASYLATGLHCLKSIQQHSKFTFCRFPQTTKAKYQFTAKDEKEFQKEFESLQVKMNWPQENKDN